MEGHEGALGVIVGRVHGAVEAIRQGAGGGLARGVQRIAAGQRQAEQAGDDQAHAGRRRLQPPCAPRGDPSPGDPPQCPPGLAAGALAAGVERRCTLAGGRAAVNLSFAAKSRLSSQSLDITGRR
jgi:hypothetical protein